MSSNTDDVPPNQTIYINNLNEKVKLDGLKKSLIAVFSQFGKIVDVLAFKTLKHHGQAWVVFDDVTSATNALKQMQGFPFYDKPMRIQYAKTKSDVVAKADNTFVPRERRKRHEERAEKKRREQQHDANQAGMGLNPYAGAYGATPMADFMNAYDHVSRRVFLMDSRLLIEGAISISYLQSTVETMFFASAMVEKAHIIENLLVWFEGLKLNFSMSMIYGVGVVNDMEEIVFILGHEMELPYPGVAKSVQEAPALPNNILFVQNLPHETNPMMLQMRFTQYEGFKEVRMVEAKPGIAFVEYGNEMQSTQAMHGLQGYMINAQPMQITYAKK
ncbi:hypothetical protein IFM89_014346 [Coptis chinensis]|uniref:RRM domain-containing protein n=1 Tax=Coptis chinensis TaxID=261450 RepID=A0A835IQB9_9MAGN|nr:hypothetical protein IFM89_014346 [Coptis chinensis]